jgi:hypothetical protein
MLILAKKYDEETLPCVINSLKYFYKNNESEKLNLLYSSELKDNDINLILKNTFTYFFKFGSFYSNYSISCSIARSIIC